MLCARTQRSGGSINKRRSSEKGRPRARTIFDNRANGKELKKNWRIFRFAFGADIASGDGDERRTIANQLGKREKVPEIHYWTTCSSVRKWKGKTLAFLVGDHREQSSGQFEEQRHRRESHSVDAGQSSQRHAVRLKKHGR